MTYLMQARIEEFVHKVKLVMLILLSRQLEIAEYSGDSVGWAPTSICLDWRVVWNEPSGCQGLREQDAGRNKRKGEDGELYTLNPTAVRGGSRRFRLWHSSLHSNNSRLRWKSKERLVQLAQSGQALKNINIIVRKRSSVDICVGGRIDKHGLQQLRDGKQLFISFVTTQLFL